jgi:heme/copper-type cytochrome/quinol oxidase subunit 2
MYTSVVNNKQLIGGRPMQTRRSVLIAILLLVGCATTQLFEAVPSTLNKETAPKQTIEMTAEHFHFTPEELNVKEGTLVTLRITSIDGSHGFALGAFGIDEELKANETKTVEFYAAKKGEYKFKCSHFCGLGHLGMTGKIIVE